MSNSQLEALQELLGNISPATEAFVKAVKHAVEKNDPGFSVRFVTKIEQDKVRFDVDFFRLDGAEDYTLERLKTVVMGEIPIPHGIINGIDTRELEEKMTKVPWHKMARSAQEEGQSANERKALPIFLAMQALKKSPEGLKVVRLLEAKYLSNSAMVAQTPLQRLYDHIEEEHSRVFTFGFDPVKGPSFEQAYQMVTGRSPQAPPYQGRLFKVEVDGIDFSYLETPAQALTLPRMREHYFTSLQKAVEFTNSLDERTFFPRIAVEGRMAEAIKSTVISDEFTDTQLAAKVLLCDLQLDGKMVLGWEISTERMSVAEFSQRSGYQLDKLEQYQGDPAKFITAREENMTMPQTQLQPRKAAKPGKKKGNGLA